MEFWKMLLEFWKWNCVPKTLMKMSAVSIYNDSVNWSNFFPENPVNYSHLPAIDSCNIHNHIHSISHRHCNHNHSQKLFDNLEN